MHPDSKYNTLWSVGSSPMISYVLPRLGQEAHSRHAKVKIHDPPPGSIPRLHFQHRHRQPVRNKLQNVFVFLFGLGPLPVMSFNLYSIRNEIGWKYVFLKHDDGVEHILARCRLDISFQLLYSERNTDCTGSKISTLTRKNPQKFKCNKKPWKLLIMKLF